MKILILGASGMLGSMMLKVFSTEAIKDGFNNKILATLRDNNHRISYPNVEYITFDAEHDSIEKLHILLADTDWVINCIGVIKPYIHDNNSLEVERAIKINSLFPIKLAQALVNSNAKVIQIATDCVFSGTHGGYSEKNTHDPIDVYGKSKSLGEAIADKFYNLRVSIIGPENKTHKSFLDWVLTQPKGATLKGFTNHLWNGVTTLHFSKICLGIVKENIILPNMQHIVPGNILDKYTMVEYFKKCYNRDDLIIEKTEASQSMLRTLKTNDPDLNTKIWLAAGYNTPPTIENMIEELSKYRTN